MIAGKLVYSGTQHAGNIDAVLKSAFLEVGCITQTMF